MTSLLFKPESSYLDNPQRAVYQELSSNAMVIVKTFIRQPDTAGLKRGFEHVVGKSMWPAYIWAVFIEDMFKYGHSKFVLELVEQADVLAKVKTVHQIGHLLGDQIGAANVDAETLTLIIARIGINIPQSYLSSAIKTKPLHMIKLVYLHMFNPVLTAADFDNAFRRECAESLPIMKWIASINPQVQTTIPVIHYFFEIAPYETERWNSVRECIVWLRKTNHVVFQLSDPNFDYPRMLMINELFLKPATSLDAEHNISGSPVHATRSTRSTEENEAGCSSTDDENTLQK